MADAQELDWREDRVEHIAEHGVDAYEFEDAFFGVGRTLIRVGPADRNPRETIYYVFGQTMGGRYLFMVILLYTNRRVALPVAARDMTASERRWYRR